MRKFELLDNVIILVGENRGKIGFIHTIRETKNESKYAVRLKEKGLPWYDEAELKKHEDFIKEKVVFT